MKTIFLSLVAMSGLAIQPVPAQTLPSAEMEATLVHLTLPSGTVHAPMPAERVPTGKVDDSNFFGPLPTAEALAIAHRYAACLVEKRPTATRNVLAMDFQSDAYAKEMNDIGSAPSNCVRPGRLRVSTIIFAAALAEEAYTRDFGVADVRTLLPADWSGKPIKARSESEATALCLVQRDPAAARALIDTQVASDGEKVQLSKLATSLSQCVSAGATFRLNRPALRAIVSLALYRSARHFAGQDV